MFQKLLKVAFILALTGGLLYAAYRLLRASPTTPTPTVMPERVTPEEATRRLREKQRALETDIRRTYRTAENNPPAYTGEG